MTRLLLPMKTCGTRVDESYLPGAENVIVCVTLVLREFDKRFRSQYPKCVFGIGRGYVTSFAWIESKAQKIIL